MNSSRFHEHLASEFSNDVEYPQRVSKSDYQDRADIIAQIREATSAPSPLTGTRSREPRRSSSILGLVLAEEEKQAHKLKSMLRSTGDRLDREIRRANQAVARAEHAESRVHDLTARVSKAESSKHLVELEAARAKEEIKRHQLQIESLEREVRRLQADVSLLEKQRNEADESAARSRDTARNFQLELRNLQSKEAGREEGKRVGMYKWFKTGRIEGWDTGHTEGFESGRDEGFEEGREYGIAEGRKKGRQEGFDEGWEQGRREEREHALQAFDEFFATEIDQQDHAFAHLSPFISTSIIMASATAPPPLPSPGLISGRRKGAKNHPRLPLSAFSPPNTGTSESFPLPPTPSSVVPEGVVDSHLEVTPEEYKAVLSQKETTGVTGTVLTVKGQKPEDLVNWLQDCGYGRLSSVSDTRILSVLVPFTLEDTPPSEVPAYLSPAQRPLATLATTFTGANPVAAESLRWALQHSKVVDIDVQGDITATDASFYDSFVNLLIKATKPEAQSAEDMPVNERRTPIVLANILPPPVDSDAPIMTIMNQPAYMAYQQRVSSLSLFENVHVKFLPPVWSSTGSTASAEEWKHKLKLYIGPVLEAFGFQRIIFGSSPSAFGDSPELPESLDWYHLVQESFRELGVNQEDINKVFKENAESVYGSSS
ncbi:hypothetical protein HYDPIDRAFT_173620 [Hydnomerulius pinastri MD-312]|nr:hypothetical protein HYDPIDRAFT_173620 [Hydnomerulius pinastri MD-312]